MGRGGEDAVALVKVRTRDKMDFFSPSKNLTRKELAEINKETDKRLTLLAEEEFKKYQGYIKNWEELEALCDFYHEYEEALSEFKEKGADIPEKMAKDKKEKDKLFFHLTSLGSEEGLPFTSSNVDYIEKIITMPDTPTDAATVEEALLEQAKGSVVAHVASKKGVWMEDSAFEIAKKNKDLKVPLPAIAGFGVKGDDLAEKSETQRKIYHRVKEEHLNEAVESFMRELKKVSKEKRDAYGAVTEETFEEIRRKIVKRLRQKAQENLGPEKESPYDLIIEKDGILTVWELKSSGHVGSKNSEYKKLLENTLLLSLEYPEKKIQPFFGLGAYSKKETLMSNRDIPSGHILTADLFWDSILPGDLSWEKDYISTRHWSNFTPSSKKKYIRQQKQQRKNFFRKKKSKSKKKAIAQNANGNNFYNAFQSDKYTAAAENNSNRWV